MKWSGDTHSNSEPDGVVSRGAFNVRGLYVAFATSEPSPGRWIAIATVRGRSTSTDHRPTCMLVGRGRTEAGAVADLRWRVMDSEALPLWPDLPAPIEQMDVVWEDDPEITLES